MEVGKTSFSRTFLATISVSLWRENLFGLKVSQGVMLCVESFVPLFCYIRRNMGKRREASHTVVVTEFIQFIQNAASENGATLLLKLLHCGHYLCIILCCARRRLSSEWSCA